MKDYKGPGGYQSAPLGPPAGGESQEGPPEIKWVSEGLSLILMFLSLTLFINRKKFHID